MKTRTIVPLLMLLTCITLAGCGSGGSTSTSSTTTTTASPSPSATPSTAFLVVPPIASVASSASLVLWARNTTGTVTYTLSTNNSGGVITSSGVYTAGVGYHVTDLVTVADESGTSLTVPILVSPAVQLSPAGGVVAVNTSTNLNAAGGSGTGYTYAMYANNSYGAVTNGVYQAGPNANKIDIVDVVDSNGSPAFGLFAVGPKITVSATQTAVAPGGQVTFSASGGSGTYAWYLSSNLSGGNLNSATGVYTAGPHGGVDDCIIVGDAEGYYSVAVETVTQP